MPEIISIFDTPDYESEIARGAKLLSEGGIVVLPTETVYGAAGLLTHARGNARLRELRQSDGSRPFTAHVAHRNDALKFLGDVSDLGKRMMRKLWPGPVGLMFDVPDERRAQVAAGFKLPENDLYQNGRITLRCPDHFVVTDLLQHVDGPVALTRVGSTDWGGLEGKAELVFDAGPSKYSKPSTIVHISGEQYEIAREGVYDQRIIERLLRTTILFICSGNTCRSPMSEALTRMALAKKLGISEEELEKRGISVISAGSFAMPGTRAAAPAIEAIHQLGGDLSRHRSRTLSIELIHQADRIFTMGRSHAAAVAMMVPGASEKTSTLDPDGDIEDPIGGDTTLYLSLAKQLQELIAENVVNAVVP